MLARPHGAGKAGHYQRVAAGTMPAAVPRSVRWSIRARLLAIATGAALAAWGAGGVATMLSAREVHERLLDERLAQVARTVLAFADHELAEIARDAGAAQPHVEPGVALGTRYHLQVWSREGRLLLRSANAPADVPLAPHGDTGFGAGRLAGAPTRTYREAPPALPVEIQVAETLADRDTALPRPGLAYALGGLAAVLLIAGTAAAFVLRALRPLERAARALRERTPLDLTPLPLDGAPLELEPMLSALNALFDRVAKQLSAERGFTALAAHELRAPLAALRMQAQVAARTPDAGQRGTLLAAVLASVDRCSHLLEQLLTLSRVDDATPAAVQRIVLADTLATVQASLAAETTDAARPVRVTARFDAPAVHGQPFGVQTLLRNLLQNALRHAAGRVELHSDAVAGGVRLRVDDDGPGIAPADRERVFDRFVRLDTPAFGVGLGLSIVQSVARAHGARVTLADSPLGGLRVELWFPDAAA